VAQTVIELLVKIQLIDDRQHDSAMSRSRSSAGGHVVQTIAELGYATESTIARALSVELGLPRVDLSVTPPEQEALALLDSKTCMERFVLPIAQRESGELLWLAMGDPTDSDSIALVRRKAQKRVRPVVAGPTEILRAAARLYSTPMAHLNQPEGVDPDKLSAIEIKDETAQDAFEVVNVMDDAASPLSRIAAQLGVAVPQSIQRRQKPVEATAGGETRLAGNAEADQKAHLRTPAQARGPSSDAMPPPGPPLPTEKGPGVVRPPEPAPRPGPSPAADDEALRVPGPSRGPAHNDLSPEDLLTMEALRSSLEKGALVLRAIAELCVEKGLFTREEMGRRRS
jgi:hypothetical protein